MRVTKVPACAAAAMIAFALPQFVRAQQRGPSTPEERAKAVAIAHALEEDPLAKDAKEKREWMIQWLMDIPDITVKVCSAFVGDLPKAGKNHSTEIFSQMILSGGAFMIEHPEKAQDEQAVHLAGLQSALHAYEAILKKEPDAHWPYLDTLVKKRDAGTLADYVRETIPKCQ